MSKKEVSEINCALFLEKHGATLQRYAWRSLHEECLTCDEFIVFGITVDTRWISLVRHLDPEHDWEGHVEVGNNAVALGVMPWERFDPFTPGLTELVSLRNRKKPDGLAYCVILTEAENFFGYIIPVSPHPTN